MNASQRISSGYEKSPNEMASEREARRKELAALFKPNDQMESLLKLRDQGESISAALRMSAALYEKERDAFYEKGEFSPE